MILRQLCLLYDNSYEIYVDQHHNILFCLGLENKIISLQQRLTDANAENKALKQQVIYQLKLKYAFNIIYRLQSLTKMKKPLGIFGEYWIISSKTLLFYFVYPRRLKKEISILSFCRPVNFYKTDYSGQELFLEKIWSINSVFIKLETQNKF